MNTSSGQSNVTIENGNSDIEGYNRGGRSYQSNILSLKIDLENNYWGNTSDIPSTINDYNDDISREKVTLILNLFYLLLLHQPLFKYLVE